MHFDTNNKVVFYFSLFIEFSMILGHGIDIVDLKRIEKTYNKFGERFINKFLTEEEKQLISHRKNIIGQLAKHWAVKEAVSKAVGCGLINGSPLHFKDIVLSHNIANMPIIVITPELQDIVEYMHSCSDFNFHISTSGDAGAVIASVILETR